LDSVRGAAAASIVISPAAKEIKMKKKLLVLLLLALALSGCIVEPGGGHRDGPHGEYHSERGENGWNR